MRRVLVTRPSGQESSLIDLLSRHGINGISVPTVTIAPPSEAEQARLIRELETADWLVITSANGAIWLSRTIGSRALPDSIRVAAVGPATAAKLRGFGFDVTAVPERYLTVEIADALGDVRGKRIVLARADSATAQLRDALLTQGAVIVEVTAYRTIEGPPDSRDRLGPVLEEELDAILFTSGSTVRGLLHLLPAHLRPRITRLPAICIGPVTAEVARKAGFVVAAVASEHTAEGLAQATAAHFMLEAV